MDLTMIIPFAIGVLVLFIVLKLLTLPMKLIVKLLINSIVGGIAIFVINLIGANFNFAIDLNWFSAIIVGVLGLPGAIIVAILQFIM